MGGNPMEDYKHYKDQTDPAKGMRRYIFHKVVESAQGCEMLWYVQLVYCGWLIFFSGAR